MLNAPLYARGSKALSQDAKNRCRLLHANLTCPVGAYTTSKGWEFVRDSVADFINTRDGLEGEQMSSRHDIYLTNGASEAVRTILKAAVRSNADGVLVPIPQYPLYSA